MSSPAFKDYRNCKFHLLACYFFVVNVVQARTASAILLDKDSKSNVTKLHMIWKVEPKRHAYANYILYIMLSPLLVFIGQK